MISRLIQRALSKHDYEEWTYWNKRQDPNVAAGWDPDFLKSSIDYIRRHTENCDSVLELGPGVGRTLDAYSKECDIRAYDISQLYREKLLAKVQTLGLKLQLDLAQVPGEDLPYGDRQFEAGVASQVFLHQRPQNIEHMMREMIRVCEKVVVITGGYGRAPRRADHVFGHDYPTLCARLGCEMHHVRAQPPQLFFVYAKSLSEFRSHI